MATVFLVYILGQLVLFTSFLIAKSKEKAAPKKKGRQLIQELQNQIIYLQQELDTAKNTSASQYNELQEVKKANSELDSQLQKQKELYSMANLEINQLKQKNSELTESLLIKEKILENSIAQEKTNQNKLKEKDAKITALEKEKNELALQIKNLRAEQQTTLIKEKEELTNQLLKQKELISQLKEEIQLKDNELKNISSQTVNKNSQLIQAEEKKLKEAINNFQLKIKTLEMENLNLQQQLQKKEQGLNLAIKELEQEKTKSTKFNNELDSKEKEIKQLNSKIQTLENQAKEDSQKMLQLEQENQQLKDKLKSILTTNLKDNNQPSGQSQVSYQQNLAEPPSITEDEIKRKTQIDIERKKNRDKIGQILLQHNLITKEILDKALKYQQEFGGNITQYLLGFGYVDEGELAKCLCVQFGIPYLPLRSYKIPDHIIKLIPVNIAERYWLIPVDKFKDTITVVMVDPFNTKAIKEIEQLTGCAVQPFLGLLSEVVDALENYYNIIMKGTKFSEKSSLPFFIETQTYQGPERRRSIRYKTNIDVNFAEQNQYKASKIKDISYDGFLFESEKPLTIGSIATFQINLPKEWSQLPIAAIVQIMRVKQLEKNKFDIGARIIKIAKDELSLILKYASNQSK